MIILEGADLTFKTTLAHKLLATDYCQKLGMTYAHLGQPPIGHDHLWDYKDRICRTVVQDRFHMSEVVYRHACGEPCILDPERYRLIDAWLREVGAITVLLYSSEEEIKERWREGEKYGIDLVFKANGYYRELAISSRLCQVYCADVDLIAYTKNSESLNTVVDQICKFHAKRGAFLRRQRVLSLR